MLLCDLKVKFFSYSDDDHVLMVGRRDSPYINSCVRFSKEDMVSLKKVVDFITDPNIKISDNLYSVAAEISHEISDFNKGDDK